MNPNYNIVILLFIWVVTIVDREKFIICLKVASLNFFILPVPFGHWTVGRTNKENTRAKSYGNDKKSWVECGLEPMKIRTTRLLFRRFIRLSFKVAQILIMMYYYNKCFKTLK